MTEVIFGECIFEVWPAPGVRERLSKGRGRSLPTTGRLSRAPGAGQTSKTHSKNKAGLLSYTFSSCADVAAGGAAVHPLRELLYTAPWPKWLVIFECGPDIAMAAIARSTFARDLERAMAAKLELCYGLGAAIAASTGDF